MGLFSRLFGTRSRRNENVESRLLQARFDAAQTTEENAAHWAAADALSPTAALTSAVRRTLRNRARYEVANNSYAYGIVETITAFTVGTGPVLQVHSKSQEVNDRIEDEFTSWAQEVGLAALLRLMRRCVVVDGEAFVLFCSNPRIPGPVKLDLRAIEADQVSEGPGASQLQYPVEGIVFDDYGRPVAYHILRRHPGDYAFGGADFSYDTIPADLVVHYFHQNRPGQARGVPEIAPALPLFSIQRRYALATAGAAETAASVAAVLQTDSAAYIPRDAERFARELVWQFVDLRPRSATVLPPGWKLAQMTAQQPSTTYGDFTYYLMTEIARCLSVPVVVALNDSSRANFSSGRLDLRNWYRTIEVERSLIESVVLEKILQAWYREWRCANESFADRYELPRRMPRHDWFWPALEGVDPEKEAKAQAVRLQNGLTTLAHEYAKAGRDWETELRQRAREIELARSLGILDSLGGTKNESEKDQEDSLAREEDSPTPGEGEAESAGRP